MKWQFTHLHCHLPTAYAEGALHWLLMVKKRLQEVKCISHLKCGIYVPYCTRRQKPLQASQWEGKRAQQRQVTHPAKYCSRVWETPSLMAGNSATLAFKTWNITSGSAPNEDPNFHVGEEVGIVDERIRSALMSAPPTVAIQTTEMWVISHY